MTRRFVLPLALAASAWASTAGAQQVTETKTTTTTATAMKPASTTTTTRATYPAAAANPSESEIVHEKGGPSSGMLAAGFLAFGFAYVPALAVGATSNLDADRELMVPFAGPWLALGGRPACGGTSSRDCETEDANKVLIVTSGVVQALGGLTMIAAFLNPEERTRTKISNRASFRVSPMTGRSELGLAATGSF